MKTLEDEWRRYAKACYPTGLPVLQETETRQAFFFGALIVLKTACDNTENLDPEQTFTAIVRLITEVETVCRQRIYEMKGRN